MGWSGKVSKEVRFELSSERQEGASHAKIRIGVNSSGTRNSKYKGPEVGTACLSGGAERNLVCLAHGGQGQE